MHELYAIKDKLMDEIGDYSQKENLSMNDLTTVHLLTDTIKNICKIGLLAEEEGESSYRRSSYRGGSSRDGGSAYYRESSMRRGRDRMGRFTSYARGGNYSRAEAKDQISQQLEELMQSAQTEQERKVLQTAMQALEEA